MSPRLMPPAIIALLALALAPAWFSPLPGMVDYPNHLARIAILAHDGTADANRYYHAAWAPLPNIALDALATPLARLVGPAAAVSAFYLLAQTLVVTGAIALEVAVKGEVRLSPFSAAAFLFNAPFALGFLNFEFGVGLALWALAGWVALGPGMAQARFALTLIVEPALYFSHLFALGAFGFVAGLMTWAQVLSKRRTIAGAALDFAILAAPAVALELSFDPGAGATVAQWSFSGKVNSLLLSFNGADAWVARADALILLAVAAALGVSDRLKLGSEGVVVGVGLAALFVILPTTMRGGALVDLRALTVAMFVMPAYLDVRFATGWEASIGALLAAVFAALNVGAVALNWRRLAPDQAAIIASFAKLPPRAKVLVAYTGEDEFPEPLRHVPTLSTGDDGAFVADLFAYRGQQPLAASPDVIDLVIPEQTDMPTPGILREAIKDPPKARSYLQGWQKRFDALYVVGPREANLTPELLTPLASGQRFDLYKIEK